MPTKDKVQKKQAVQANKHRRAVDWDVGDKVWVSTKHWRSDRPSRKLGSQQEGPYEVLEKVGKSYRLALPGSNHVHPVIHADKLRKDPNNPLPGQHNNQPVVVEYHEGPEYEVEEVIASRKRGMYRIEYRAKWTGLDYDEVWYNASGFKGAPHKLQEFHTRYPKAVGPPKNLAYWLECYEKGVEPEKRQDDDYRLMRSGRASSEGGVM
ncbi:hypothetical protein HYALB_00012892 [Hymenoscyphus albidus]|uniref:Chromo domain-containing protein n=1 Tax=Hymenoscyphus albidus TaxID=595503 RepID=A0A9N9LXG3_9HELO|nr:hypothetical protein HYALB_00012892 [Hymenoscyphus albidus]